MRVVNLSQRREGMGKTPGTDDREQMIDELARRLDGWRLATPAIAFLEVHKPVCFLASQTLLAFQPLLTLLLGEVSVGEYASLLEDCGSVERVICRLEELREQGGPAR
jgi:hypothetical protein